MGIVEEVHEWKGIVYQVELKVGTVGDSDTRKKYRNLLFEKHSSVVYSNVEPCRARSDVSAAR